MDVFAAVADPTRRKILDLLRRGERPAGELVDSFPEMSQPAVSQHLKVLREARLVSVRPAAQQRIYALHPEGLSELDRWIATYRPFWETKLDALEKHLDALHPPEKTETLEKPEKPVRPTRRRSPR